MLISNVLTGPQPRQNDAPPPQEETASEPSADSSTESTPTRERTAANKTAAPQDASRSQSTANADPVAQSTPPEAAPTSRADDEAFARAAAQRAVDSARTRALLDTIDPVQNAGVKAAKSYLTAVEPKAPAADDAKAANSAKPAPLDKAA